MHQWRSGQGSEGNGCQYGTDYSGESLQSCADSEKGKLTGLLLLRAAALQVAQHEAPIKCVKWVDQNQGLLGRCCSLLRVGRDETDVPLLPPLATGSWDKVRPWAETLTPVIR